MVQYVLTIFLMIHPSSQGLRTRTVSFTYFVNKFESALVWRHLGSNAVNLRLVSSISNTDLQQYGTLSHLVIGIWHHMEYMY